MAAQKNGATGKRIGVLIVVVVAAVVVAVVVAAARPTESQNTATTFEYTLPVNPYHFLENGDPEQLTMVLDKAKAAGVESIQSGAVWWRVKSEQSSEYDWSGLDRLVDEAEARGMTVRLQLSGTPKWVHPDLADEPESIWYPPVRNDTELDHWSTFVRDVVSRYKGRVTRYEMWNEPNIEEFWKPSPNPADYVALLRASYLSAKSADPNTKVVFGGLSRNDVGYLEAYYSEVKDEAEYPDAANNEYFFDVLGVHPYSSSRSTTAGELEKPISPDAGGDTPGTVSGGIDQTFPGVERMKIAMDDEGDPGKPLYLGEYGFSTEDTWMEAVPEWRRALYLKRAYTLARDLPYVEGLSWYAYHPNSSTGSEWTILQDDLDETMSFRALRQVSGAEQEGATVTLSAPEAEVSGTYEVNPTAVGLGSPSYWELYVDGVPQGTTRGEVPFDWDTTSVADGAHTLMVVAYPQEGSGQEGTVWPSNLVTVEVDNETLFGSFLSLALQRPSAISPPVRGRRRAGHRAATASAVRWA